MLPSSEKVVGYIPTPSSTIDGRWKPNIDLAPNCPRCDSSNTKFCYYNNYSLTQPRYFCKGCRRYWTKGGSLRNVPVGGGCRKSRPRGRIVRPVTNSTTSNLTQLQTNSIRPDVILNDPSLNGGDGSAAIDLAVLYAKFSKQSEPGFQSTGLVTVPNDLTVEDVDFSGKKSSDYQPDLVGIVDCQNGNNIPCLDPTMEMQFCSGFLGLSELDNHFDVIKTGAGNSCGSQLLSVDESVASGDLFWSNYYPTMTTSSIWQPQQQQQHHQHQQQHQQQPLLPNQFGFVSPGEDSSSMFNTNWISNTFDSSCFDARS